MQIRNKIGKKLAIVALFVLALLWTTKSLYRIIITAAPDFSVFWLATRDFVVGKNPYENPELFTGLGYPVNTLLFYFPLLPFSYTHAQAIFTLLSTGAIAAAGFLSLKLTAKKTNWQLLIFLLSLTFLSFPTKFTLGMGQNNAIALLILLLSFFFYQKKKIPTAGILLGITVSLKTIFAFFFLFYLIKREWKLLLYSIIPLLVSVILVAVVNDVALYLYWISKVVPPLLNLQGREIYYNQGLMGFISRLTGNLMLRRTITALSSLILLAAVGRLTLKKGQEILQFSLFIIVLLLIDTLSWQHHFIWLIYPFVVLVSSAVRQKNLKLLTLLGLSYLLVSWNFKNPEAFSTFPKNLLLSNTFYGTLILFLINAQLLASQKKSPISVTIRKSMKDATCKEVKVFYQ